MADDLRNAVSGAARAAQIVATSGTAAALVAMTIAKLGLGANSLAWALVQCLLVGLAAFDLATSRIPNVVTAPAAVVAVLMRLALERSALPGALLAGVATACFFYLFALRTRGLGMGDVKLAGLLGLVLGRAVLPGLVVGTIVGGIVSLGLIIHSRAWLHRTLAYGPFLCLGGVAAILAFNPPALV